MERFEELTLPHMGVLYRMALHLSGNKDDAEDMVHEVYLKAGKSFHSLKDHNKCKSWLCSILYRHFIDECRRAKRFGELKYDVPAPQEVEQSHWPENIGPEELKIGLEKLDPKYRLPLVAHFLSGQSYKDIANSLEIPIGTVMSRIHRAKNLMRSELTQLAKPGLRVVKGGSDGV